MTIERKLLGTTPVSGEVLPEAVSFDGTNDYLSRSSDMTGNADGKTFTLSFWIYPSGAGTHRVISFGGNRLFFTVAANGEYSAGARNSSNSVIFTMGAASGYPYVAFNTWNHVLLSINLANSSERHLYINDGTIPPNFTAYTNQNIDFTNSEMGVGAYTLGSAAYKTKAGRLAHVFLDYTYRDLSTTSNRRLFIDADGKPSSTIPSSPILYLPMTDAATAGSNSGTGGDFTVNGVLATAQRGPNQDNCSASTFDGSADYLNISSLTNAADSKLFTFSAVINRYSTANGSMAILGGMPDKWLVSMTTGGEIYIVGDSGNVMAWNSVVTYAIGSTHHIAASFDLTNTSRRYVYVDGVAVSGSYSVYNNTNFSNANIAIQVGKGESSFSPLIAGELYFNTAYTDLSADNPFWDSDTNLPNSVRKVIADTSVTPLIALPLMGNNAGNNLGSGGDFTVNSGPYTGARGGSEFWARSIYSAGNAQYLQSTSLSSMGQFTMVTGLNMSRGGNAAIVAGSGATYFDSEQAVVRFWNSNNEVVRFGVSTAYVSGWVTLLVSVNLSTNTAYCYVNGASMPILSNNMSSYTTADFNPLKLSSEGNTSVSSFYLDDSYIDFSQEANRNKFVDQLGYLRDLTQQIEDGDVVEPLVYMKFNNTSSLVTNSGTGSNFTDEGTGVLPESDFNL